jgi:hypothetical protein
MRRGRTTARSARLRLSPPPRSASVVSSQSRESRSRRRRVRERARARFSVHNTSSNASGSARVMRARRTDKRVRGRTEKYESCASKCCVSARCETVATTACESARHAVVRVSPQGSRRGAGATHSVGVRGWPARSGGRTLCPRHSAAEPDSDLPLRLLVTGHAGAQTRLGSSTTHAAGFGRPPCRRRGSR